MACSTYESATVTCYVPHGNHLLPVCVPSDTRLTDLVGALHDANVNLRETKSKKLRYKKCNIGDWAEGQ